MLFALTVPVREHAGRADVDALAARPARRVAAPRRCAALAELEGAAIAGHQLMGRRLAELDALRTVAAVMAGGAQHLVVLRRALGENAVDARLRKRLLSRYPGLGTHSKGRERDMPFNVGPLELVIVLVIALVILGPKRLPEVGKSIGNGMREFKDAISGHNKDDDDDEITSLKASERTRT